jgi:hypothetical protein
MTDDGQSKAVAVVRKAIAAVLLLFVGVSVAYMVVREARGGAPAPERTDARVVVYYFHGNYRCETCNTIQRLTQETVAERFAEEMDEGLVEMRSVNVDEPGNRHFTDEYELTTRTVVVARFNEAGKRIGWKALLDVWDLYNRPAEFKDYVEAEVIQALPQETQ